jgi:hypothetical protein
MAERERGSDTHRVALPAADSPAAEQCLADGGVPGAWQVGGEQGELQSVKPHVEERKPG